MPDGCDACPLDNPDDTDGDGVCDSDDACPFDNPNDTDADGVCDTDDAWPGFDDTLDADNDGAPDGCDSCPNDPDNDIDGDSVCGDVDNCPNTPNADQTDANNNGVGDACEGGCSVLSSHVASIVLSTVDGSKGQKRGRAQVTVEDNCGNPVAGVVVTGSFSGDLSGSDLATTNSSGVAVLLSAQKKGRAKFTFCVDDVDDPSYVAGNNVETCESF